MRTVMISGASSDIGLFVCRRYLAAGWRVLAHYRTPRPELDELAGPALQTWQADFTDHDGLQRRLNEEAAFFTQADAFVNLSASMPNCTFGDADADQILSALAVNLVPGLLIMQKVGPAMAERKWGRIVHASSIGVKFGGGSESFLYSLSKHALEFIPRAVRAWAAQGVFVNVARIGVTATRAFKNYPDRRMADRVALIPARRAAEPAEIAEFLFWLGSDSNGFVTGEVLPAAGGE